MYVYIDFKQVEMIRDSESLNEMELAHSSFSEMQTAVSDMHLWRMQVFAMARLRFLKLKRQTKVLLTLWVAEYCGFVRSWVSKEVQTRR